MGLLTLVSDVRLALEPKIIESAASDLLAHANGIWSDAQTNRYCQVMDRSQGHYQTIHALKARKIKKKLYLVISPLDFEGKGKSIDLYLFISTSHPDPPKKCSNRFLMFDSKYRQKKGHIV